jgi:hypothetical protein
MTMRSLPTYGGSARIGTITTTATDEEIVKYASRWAEWCPWTNKPNKLVAVLIGIVQSESTRDKERKEAAGELAGIIERQHTDPEVKAKFKFTPNRRFNRLLADQARPSK